MGLSKGENVYWESMAGQLLSQDLSYGLRNPAFIEEEAEIREVEGQPQAHSSKALPLRGLALDVRPSFSTPGSSSGLDLRRRH